MYMLRLLKQQGLICVAGLEHAMQTWLDLNSERSTCLSLLSVKIKDM